MKKKSSAESTKISKLILALCELVLGVVLLINPSGFTKAIIIILGVLLLAMGLICIVRYFKELPQEAAKEQNLTRGLLAAAVGLFCVCKSEWFMVTFPLLTVMYGVMMVVTGAAKIQWAVDMVRIKMDKWFLAAISAGVTLIGSVVILSSPFASQVSLWMFIAIAFIIEAILDAAAVFFVKESREQLSNK